MNSVDDTKLRRKAGFYISGKTGGIKGNRNGVDNLPKKPRLADCRRREMVCRGGGIAVYFTLGGRCPIFCGGGEKKKKFSFAKERGKSVKSNRPIRSSRERRGEGREVWNFPECVNRKEGGLSIKHEKIEGKSL